MVCGGILALVAAVAVAAVPRKLVEEHRNGDRY